MQLEAVTLTASRLAGRHGRDYYILERQPSTPGPPVIFWWDAASLARLLQAGAPDGRLRVVRVAHPDGRVEPVDDPDTYAHRLAEGRVTP